MQAVKNIVFSVFDNLRDVLHTPKKAQRVSRAWRPRGKIEGQSLRYIFDRAKSKRV